MSITATYIRLFPEEWNSLLELSQDEFDNFQLSLIVTDSEKKMDLDGDWQALHFLLTGKIAEVSDDEVRPATSDPLESVVMGGVDTKFSSGYGYVRYLSPETVKVCSSALNQVTEAHYSSRLVPAIFNAAYIFPYSTPDYWDEDELDILYSVVSEVKRFFEVACEENQAILIDL